MIRFGLCFLVSILVVLAEEEEVDYSGTNVRVIGGDPVDNHTVETPFIITYKTMRYIPEFCSGVLISKRLALTAASCFHHFITDEAYKECELETNMGKFYKYTNPRNKRVTQVKCKFENSGLSAAQQFVITPSKKSRGIAYLKSTNRNKKKQTTFRIKKIIVYPTFISGKKYDSYGGSDIALIELMGDASKLPSSEASPHYACITKMSFNDTILRNKQISVVAGYGNYTRNADEIEEYSEYYDDSDEIYDTERFENTGYLCQTNEYGRSKHHYCYTAKNASEEMNPCKLEGDDGYDDIPEPEPECNDFFKNNKIGKDENEAMIINDDGSVINCFMDYNPENKRYGKCFTVGDFYDWNNNIIDTNTDNDWGYCSKECFLDPKERNKPKLRKKEKLTVLSAKDCDAFFNTSSSELRYKPEVYCVGEIKKWKVGVWMKKADKYTKVTEKSKMIEYIMDKHYGAMYYKDVPDLAKRMEYVVSPGICNGDYGGPLYFEYMGNSGAKVFVVTGIASNARIEEMGYCGGINQPLHYVKIRKYEEWIKFNTMKGEKICLTDGIGNFYYTGSGR